VNIWQLCREGLHCVCLHVCAYEWEREMENVRKHCGGSKMSIWDVTPYGLVYMSICFGETLCPHHGGRGICYVWRWWRGHCNKKGQSRALAWGNGEWRGCMCREKKLDPLKSHLYIEVYGRTLKKICGGEGIWKCMEKQEFYMWVSCFKN